MDKIEKLFRTLSKAEAIKLLNIINLIETNRLTTLKVVKIKSTNLYRVRQGRFRMIFIKRKDSLPIVVSVTRRNEKTYKF